MLINFWNICIKALFLKLLEKNVTKKFDTEGIIMNNKLLDEEKISDIILCEPITRKGKEALDRLGLTTTEINISYFYDNLRVESKYEKNKKFENEVIDKKYDRNQLYYQYTVDSIQFEAIQERLNRFNSRFYSNSPNEYPLLMLGVAGNGKSIEINRRIRETYEDAGVEANSICFDLEDAFTKITYGSTYQCPENTTLWLFCIKLLDGIMQYIQSYYLQCPSILNNFNNIILSKNLANEEQIKFFKNIGNYYIGDNKKETRLFCSLKNLLDSEHVIENIQILLETLMWIMYCSAPNKKQYIIIDNIEQYIKLNNLKIQIPNSDISKLYKAVNTVVMNMTYSFNRIEEDLGWRAFKIIILLRRTSLGLLDSTLLHSPVKEEQNITDITGHFQVSDIWAKKKEYIWDKFLRDKFDCSENEDIIKIVNIIMNDGIKAVGVDYQSIIAPLMSYGIRRNAKAQAHAAYNTYIMLTNGREETINFDEFINLMSAIGRDNPHIRYMFRRALIEFQFKWSISGGKQDRWKNLNIGHLTGRRDCFYNGKKFMVENVAYNNDKCVTLMRRILAYLSCFPEEYNENINGQCRSVVDMFSTLSLFDLMQGVFTNPRGHLEISENIILQFARVLLSLSDMSNGDTKSAPYIILGINDNDFHRNTDEYVLAEILNRILVSGREESLPGKKYNCSDFGVRITDAGNSFLLDWQASFPLMAAIHCFTVPSLFFLKDTLSIKYVIETVYEASFKLCKMYENEAECFCGEGVALKKEIYLPKYKDKYITFKQRVKDLHINHLLLYRDFIEKNYNLMDIKESDMFKIKGFIGKYIDRYSSWKTTKGASKCF